MPDDTPAPRTDAEHLLQLLERIRRGDEQAFQRLYDATSAQLLGLLLRILRKRDLAEDAMQDCYLKIWRRSETYAVERGAPMAWLLSVARYRALDLLRRQSSEIARTQDIDALSSVLIDARENPQDRAVESEGLRQLNRCMNQLRDEHRQCILLAYYEGYTYPELSRDLQVPVNTIKSWVRRGLASLRLCLQG